MQNLIKQVSQKWITILIPEFGHGYVIIIIEFFIAYLLKYVIIFFHIGIAKDKFLELLIKHLETVDMYKVLYVLQAHLETVKVGTQLN